MAQDTQALVEHFVTVYNQPGSDVYHLFSDKVDWFERPSGRRGGWPKLEAALRDIRRDMTDLHLDVRSVVAGERDAALETEWSATIRADGSKIRAHVIWLLSFEDGLITREHDYSILI